MKWIDPDHGSRDSQPTVQAVARHGPGLIGYRYLNNLAKQICLAGLAAGRSLSRRPFENEMKTVIVNNNSVFPRIE